MIDLGSFASYPSSGGHVKTRRLLTGLAFAPLLFATVPFFPSLSHVSAARSATISITGTMVAMPQPTAPTSLFIQVGSQTIPVWITPGTHIERSDGSAANLTDLRDNDSLRVDGIANHDAGITASVVLDLSLPALLPTATPTSSPVPAVTATTTPTSSPTQSPSQFAIVGTLNALPGQVTAPTLLCVAKSQVTGGIVPNISLVSPCAPGLLPVYIAPTTQLTRNDGSASALFELRAGDSLEAHGNFVNALYTAASLVDHSLHETSTQFTGIVQTVSPGSPMTVVTVSVNKRLSDHSPVPGNTQFALPLTDAGSVYCLAASTTQVPCTSVTINGVSTTGYTGSYIAQGSVATAEGLYNSTLNVFEFTRWISISTAQAPAATATATATATAAPVSAFMSLTGYLRSPASPNTPPTLLCVYSAQFTGGRLSPNMVTASPCPRGQLPVYVTPGTAIVRTSGGAIPVSYLHSNNRLEIKGTFVNAQFTATWIRDTSLANVVQVHFKARIAFINPSSSNPYLAVTTLRDNERGNPFRTGVNLTVYVQPSTVIYLRHNRTSHNVAVLNPGNTISVWAYYDRDESRVAPTMRISLG
jgi:hypothetical protein